MTVDPNRLDGRIRDGATVDKEALESLISKHYEGLRLLIIRKVRDSHVASDILNGAITKTLEHLKVNRLANPDQLAGWVYRVAINDLRNHLRNMNTRSDVRVGTEVLESLTGDSDTSDAVAEAKLASLVRAVIEQLSTERDRTIIRRFYLDEADKEDICREQGNLSPLHFDRVIHRARKRMKQLLQRHGFKRSDFFLLLCAA
jgi:RNA polymerase sigma-70 factor, ECF subfamily